MKQAVEKYIAATDPSQKIQLAGKITKLREENLSESLDLCIKGYIEAGNAFDLKKLYISLVVTWIMQQPTNVAINYFVGLPNEQKLKIESFIINQFLNTKQWQIYRQILPVFSIASVKSKQVVQVAKKWVDIGFKSLLTCSKDDRDRVYKMVQLIHKSVQVLGNEVFGLDTPSQLHTCLQLLQKHEQLFIRVTSIVVSICRNLDQKQKQNKNIIQLIRQILYKLLQKITPVSMTHKIPVFNYQQLDRITLAVVYIHESVPVSGLVKQNLPYILKILAEYQNTVGKDIQIYQYEQHQIQCLIGLVDIFLGQKRNKITEQNLAQQIYKTVIEKYCIVQGKYTINGIQVLIYLTHYIKTKQQICNKLWQQIFQSIDYWNQDRKVFVSVTCLLQFLFADAKSLDPKIEEDILLKLLALMELQHFDKNLHSSCLKAISAILIYREKQFGRYAESFAIKLVAISQLPIKEIYNQNRQQMHDTLIQAIISLVMTYQNTKQIKKSLQKYMKPLSEFVYTMCKSCLNNVDIDGEEGYQNLQILKQCCQFYADLTLNFPQVSNQLKQIIREIWESGIVEFKKYPGQFDHSVKYIQTVKKKLK